MDGEVDGRLIYPLVPATTRAQHPSPTADEFRQGEPTPVDQIQYAAGLAGARPTSLLRFKATPAAAPSRYADEPATTAESATF